MSSVVLDASAVLAVLRKERGANVVAPVLTGAMMSAVNYSEVLKKTLEVGGDLTIAHMYLSQCELRIVPFDAVHAIDAAVLYKQTSSRGLSFADRACLALAIACSSIVLTADTRWAKVKVPIEVKMIR